MFPFIFRKISDYVQFIVNIRFSRFKFEWPTLKRKQLTKTFNEPDDYHLTAKFHEIKNQLVLIDLALWILSHRKPIHILN